MEVLTQKLAVVASRYAKSQLEYERYAVLAVSSLYGIDILIENVAACQNRLFDIFDAKYTELFKDKASDECRAPVKYILKRNIIHGDALTLKTVGELSHPIVFSEWSPVNGSLLKRRDFVYGDLVMKSSERDLPLFSDMGDEAYIPEPVKDLPFTHFLRVADADQP